MKNSMKKMLFFIGIVVILVSCKDDKDVFVETYLVKNELAIDRVFETVEIDISGKTHANYTIIDLETEEKLIIQLVDTNSDGNNDVLLFQPTIKAKSSKKYQLIATEKTTESPINCYARFVPERTDDYAWENNKVAFRTFGPAAQKMVENKIKGGTLSSGIDAWLKSVEYPIINKWYKKHTSGEGSYHEDTGEGLDNFHVGKSRGVGGTTVKIDTCYYTSQNFSEHKNITNGPIRTSFVLNYNTWNAQGKQITEQKKISLDYGQNLSKFEIAVKGTDTISVGLTLHKKDGIISLNKNYMSYWEPFDDSQLGQGFVTTDTYFLGSEKYITSKKDESHIYTHLKVVNGKIIYYAGFGWEKSNQFKNQQEWESYLLEFSQKISNPLVVLEL